MKLTTLATALSVIALTVTQAQAACYVCDKQAWDEAHEYTREGLVAGALSVATQLLPVDPLAAAAPLPPSEVYKSDLSNCIVAMNLGATDLVEIVDTQYLDLANWAVTPDSVLLGGLQSVCAAQIDAARAARGEAPIVR